MKIVTWNLAAGDKREATATLDADLLLLQERRRCDSGEQELWTGDHPGRGLSVFARQPATVRAMRRRSGLPRYFVRYQVSAPEPFQLIHVWAQNDCADDRYVRGIIQAVELCRLSIRRQPTVIAGDFNANAWWDDDNPPDRNFSALARLLGRLGLVSAYHVHFGEEFGKESRPTFFLYRHADKPYHLDYCFIPRQWVPRLRTVTVGTHGDFRHLSDHVPVSVELL